MNEKFEDPSSIQTESDKKEFVKLFGEYLKAENILQNYDEFAQSKALQNINLNDEEAVEKFKENHFLSDEAFELIKNTKILDTRTLQDYRSVYNDIRDWLRIQKNSEDSENMTIDWDDVVFEVDLLKSQEINLDYILELIYESNKKLNNKDLLIEEVTRMIRSSIGNRAKEDLIIDFIQDNNLDAINNKQDVISKFFEYAQQKQKEEAEKLIQSENLDIV